jgi:adenine phosphoribosyltransferase
MDLREWIRDVPDFPKKGILFKDITTLLKDKDAFRKSVDMLSDLYRGRRIDKVLAVESRGFIFGAALAYNLSAGFVPVRKPGKLPAAVERITYDLEYGTDTLEIHKDAISPGDLVLVVDDLLATGGTAAAAAKLIEKLQGSVVAIAFLIELAFLHGRDKLRDYEVRSLLTF